MALLQLAQSGMRRVLTARGVRSRFEDVAGQRLHHYALEGAGRGPPVLLVHGLGGAANGWARVLFGLARRFRRVHAVDLPGHGLSPLHAAGPARLRAHADVLAAFHRQVVGGPALVVGNSLGGAMAVQLAAEAPGAVAALALLAPAGARVEEARMAETLAALAVRDAAQAHAVTRRLFHRVPLSMRLLGGQMRAVYDTPTVRALLADAPSLPYLAPEVLAALAPPVLLLWGESERLLPAEGLEYFRAHLPPHARVEVLPACGHVPHVEAPAAVVARLCRFADEQGL
jgi:pimeloyl-ACP methyl ester carboxylesterase